MAQGSNRHYNCLEMHRKNPAGGYRCTHQTLAGIDKTAKRRRRVRMELV